MRTLWKAFFLVLLKIFVCNAFSTYSRQLVVPEADSPLGIAHSRARRAIDDTESCIFNEYKAKLGQFPFYTIQYALMGNKIVLCAGSILSRDWIITSAHCFRDLAATSLEVRMGYVKWKTEPEAKIFVKEMHTVVRAIQHYPEITLYKLSSPVLFSQNIQPIRLIRESEVGQNYVNENATSVAWKEDDLHYFTIRVVGLHEYKRPNAEKMITVNYPKCRNYTLAVRPGSGLFYMDHDGLPTLISIYGGSAGYFMYSTRIGAFYSWILRTTGIPPRVG